MHRHTIRYCKHSIGITLALQYLFGSELISDRLYFYLHFNNEYYMVSYWIKCIWRPPSLSELTPMIFSIGLTHLGSEASIYTISFNIWCFRFIYDGPVIELLHIFNLYLWFDIMASYFKANWSWKGYGIQRQHRNYVYNIKITLYTVWILIRFIHEWICNI